MIPWERIDATTVPGGGELRLMRRGSEFSMKLGAAELMNSRLSGSEEAMARLAVARLGGRLRPEILVGGLGMGFTLRALLAELGSEARVTVAELVPAVVAWARGPMAELHAGSLDDPRVTIREEDVGVAIRSAPWDAILLDVDNGPEGMTRAGNDALYDMAGLGACRAALRRGGVLAVWSMGPDRHFTERLRRTGFAVEEVVARARGKNGGARHVIWLATPR